MDKTAKEINEAIKNSAMYKRYLSSKENVNTNKFLVELKNQMQELKNLNCKNSNDELVKKYYELENEYYNHILVKEYKESSEEVFLLMRDISDILSLK